MRPFLPALAVLALSISACDAASPPPEGVIQSEKANFVVETIADGLDHPWSLAFLPNGDFLVTERNTGTLLRIDMNGAKTPIAGLPSVSAEGQGGLLEVAVSPDFETTRRVYISYAGEDAQGKRNTEVAFGTLNNNRLDNARTIFRATPKTDGGNHYGGRLLFDDGFLYVTLGERFDYRDQAQTTDNHIGTLVRIRPDGQFPSDNPYTNGIFTYGHRNVQGIARHPTTGEIWTHEHGPRGGDEINIIKAGANYGWPLVSGGNHYWGTRIPSNSDNPDLTPPTHNWTPSIAPSGMAFYIERDFPAWEGNLFVGALAGQHLRRLELDGDNVIHEEELLKGMARIRDVRAGQDGNIYLLTDESNGRLLRLRPAE